ncbi:MAG: sigma-70 family RNA polymerase sigma factor [Gammaproteobacteria bacterium]|nr:sigma-70 family RNA polymerase sigma factor [Gammaproteobacteria bacterium]
MSLSILQRIARGDQNAVVDCQNQYEDLIWSLARRYLGMDADAEDAVQEILIELWSNADRFNPEAGSEVTFVSTISRRRLIDRLRKKGRAPGISNIDEVSEVALTQEDTEVAQQTEVQNVVDVLDEMESEHSKILSLSIYEGYSHSEIAEQLDMPLGTVKTKVRRGLIHIREQLNITEEDSGP